MWCSEGAAFVFVLVGASDVTEVVTASSDEVSEEVFETGLEAGRPSVGLSIATISSAMYAGFALFQLWISNLSWPLL